MCKPEEAFQSEEEKRKWASMCELTWYGVMLADKACVCTQRMRRPCVEPPKEM